MKTYRISVILGDGIGPEQVQATLKVLKKVKEAFRLDLEFVETEAGDGCKRKLGSALPDDTIRCLEATDACLKGPVGETAYDVIVTLRQMFDLYANLRPCRAYPGLECLDANTDLIVVRENTEDLYKGLEFEVADSALALRVTTRRACRRIASKAFRIAELRRKKMREQAEGLGLPRRPAGGRRHRNPGGPEAGPGVAPHPQDLPERGGHQRRLCPRGIPNL